MAVNRLHRTTDQAPHRIAVAAAHVGEPQPHDHQLAAWHDDDKQPEAAEAEVGVGRRTGQTPGEAHGVGVGCGVVEPEAGAVARLQRGSGGMLCPIRRQDLPPADHAFVQVQQAEA